MSNVAIHAENIGKSYAIAGGGSLRRDLRESIMATFSASSGADRISMASDSNGIARGTNIWALRGVSAEIQDGEVVGLIGANGSGKTTFLRILSRIVQPTEGLARIRGSVGTLLDVGAGFHGELTGRENIYLNGGLLGMDRSAIACAFDEIVAFAELQAFIDMALKHYSSGMCVRLAFAVAAHINTEILLVDEALAVADAPFKKRCLEKMATAGREGRTVLIVSHDLELIRALCNRVLVFSGGRIVRSDSPQDAIEFYQRAMPLDATHRISIVNELPKGRQ
ncbi:MAG: ABC transporter ATP-binding protein [Candidatus Acidiferrales bacterium]